MAARVRNYHVAPLAIAAAILTAGASPAPAPSKCLAAVTQAENDIRLRLQGGADEQVTARESAKVHLFIAAMAADSGNEPECWRQYGLASSYIH